MTSFEDYKKFVDGKVIKEPYGFTILRCGLETLEEYLEYSAATSRSEKFDELGDLLFWFAYFCQISGYDIDDLEVVEDKSISKIMQDLARCVKRLYRNNEVEQLVNIRKYVLPYWHQFLIRELISNLTTFEDLMTHNMDKLTERYG